TITMKIDNVKIWEWRVQSTGGWASWKTIDSCDTFELTEGQSIMRLEWSGTASSLVNLNWIEFVHHPSLDVSISKMIKKNLLPAFSINNGKIFLTHNDIISTVKLFTLEGRMIKFIVPQSNNIIIPIPKGIFIIEVQSQDREIFTYHIINTGK
ncbi:MAG: hypothetical protein N3D72_03275, partial [Candidatus Methanomethyliaceae archaeon]|nr:hypothetical protein [Candidatus Methanomethyliaceae archaeon]